MKKESLRVTCQFGRVEVARHPELSLRLRHLSGDSSQFRDFVKNAFMRIKTSSNKNEKTKKQKKQIDEPKLSISKYSPLNTAPKNGKDGDYVDNLGHMLHLGFVGACPLVDESGTTLAHLDVPREMEVLQDVIGRAGGVRWSALVGSDTTDNLRRALTSGCCVLHVSAHGTTRSFLHITRTTVESNAHTHRYIQRRTASRSTLSTRNGVQIFRTRVCTSDS